MSVKSHLIKLHKGMASLHNDVSKGRMSDAEFHEKAATLHQDCLEECQKAMDVDLTKSSLIPDNIRGVIPSNAPVTAVPRYGQPSELVNKNEIPPDLEKFLSIEL